MSDILEGLSVPQREAVENFNGPTLIIAGAGSGKTRVLTTRIANMLNHGVDPSSIMALTFTNKAAREMQERIRKVVPPEKLRGLWMGTFHSLFGRILRSEAELLGFPQTFTIYDTADSRNVVKAIVRQMELPDDTYKPKDVYSRISLAKNNLVLPEAYLVNETLMSEDAQNKRPRTGEVYAQYMNQCRRNGAMDFDDLLLYMNILLRDHPAVAQKYGSRFRYIMVDEYQDTNFSQYLIVKKLADIERNICVVGDDSQSIYSFRGARIENILRFQSDYPEAKIFKLEQNYRSTRTIVEAANSVIDKNSRKLPKKLFSAGELGDPIRVFCTSSDKEEAQRVASDINTTIQRDGATPDGFAIMYRTNAQSRILEEQLRGRNIPYRIWGGHSFYQRAEIKDALAYLRLAVNPRDDESLRRIINFPARGIGDTSLAKITAMAQSSGSSMWETILTHSPEELEIRGVAVRSLKGFVANFTELFQRSTTMDAYELAMEVMARSGIINHYKNSRSVEDEAHLQNVEELINSIKEYVSEQSKAADSEEPPLSEDENPMPLGDDTEQRVVTIGSWLQEITLLTDMDTADDDKSPKVTLLTVHASKGLEYKYTYIVGLEEQLFPGQRATSSTEEIEEERRLFYVALTRAELRATLSFATSRFKWGAVVPSQPSRFIKEIDAQYLDLPQGETLDSSDEAQAPSRWGYGSRGSSERGGAARGYERGGSDRTSDRGSSYGDAAKRTYPQRGGGAQSETPSKPIVPPSGFRPVGAVRSSAADSVSDSASASAASALPPIAAGEIALGDSVCHDRFGVGEVMALEPTASDTKVTVKFAAASAGTKTLLMKFAKLRRA